MRGCETATSETSERRSKSQRKYRLKSTNGSYNCVSWLAGQSFYVPYLIAVCAQNTGVTTTDKHF